MTVKNLTPKPLRCPAGYCKSVHIIEDGLLLIVGASAPKAAALNCIPVGEGEHAIIIDPAFLDDLFKAWQQ